MMKKKALTIFLIFLLFSLAGPVLSEDEIISKLRMAQELLQGERYSQALSILKELDKKDNLVHDVVLLYIALAESGLGEFEGSNNTAKRLIKEYPDSPLLKRAMAIEARNNISLLDSGIIVGTTQGYDSLLTEYLRSCPDDHEVSYLFARYLKKKGEIKRAKDLFLKVYKENSRFSEDAFSELDPSDITAEVLTEKASNYIREMEYKRAEGILKKALSMKDGTIPLDEIRKKLGYILFMQKRYAESEEEYLKAGDTFNAARSCFRKGDIEGFNRLLSKLVSMKDGRAGSLMIALASKKRREGNIEEALRLFEEVKKNYPQLTEEASWGIAWIYYRSGRYSDAHRVLTELNAKYPSSKYSYWIRRAREQEKGRSEDLRPSQSGLKTSAMAPDCCFDFYDALEYINSDKDFEGLKVSIDRAAALQQSNRATERQYYRATAELYRFNTLTSLGFVKEAITEVMKKIKDSKKIDVVVSAGFSLQKIGSYKNSISLASSIKKELSAEDYRDLMYPLAFWPVVESTSKRFDLDPFLVLSIIREESRFDPEARSPAGALGLMQIMPGTASRIIKKSSSETNQYKDLKDIKTNISIGAFYLKELLRDFNSLTAAIAAYNAGEERVRDWINGGNYRSVDEFIEDIPYDETRNYVKKVLTTYLNYLSFAKNIGKRYN